MTIPRSARARHAGAALALLAGSIAIASTVTASSRIQSLMAGLAFIAFCGTIVVRRGFTNGRRDLFAPPVLVSAYLALGVGIKGLSDLLRGTSKIQGLLDPTDAPFADLLTMVFLQTALAVGAFLLGDSLAGRGKAKSTQPQCPAPLLAPSGVRAALLVSICMTVLGVAVLVAKLGMAILLDPSFVSTGGTIGLFWIYPLMYASVGGWALVIVNRWSAGQPAGVTSVSALATTAATVYVVTSSKAVVVIALIYLMVGHHYTVRPARPRYLFLAAAGFMLLLPLSYLHRAFGFSRVILQYLTPDTAVAGLSLLLGRSYLADSFAAVLYHTPRIFPYRLGATWLELFYFWIPRGIWPEKPLSQSLAFGTTYLSSLQQTGSSFYSTTLMGDAYLNFGTVGVGVVFLLAGYVLSRIYDRLIGASPRPEGVVLYCTLVYWIAIGGEQPLAVVGALMTSYLAPIALLVFVARRWRVSTAIAHQESRHQVQ